MIFNNASPQLILNERSIRSSAGIMFVIGISTFWYVLLTGDFRPVYIVAPIFWVEFLLKSVINPKWGIIQLLGNLLVKNQKEQMISATPKRFAWGIGLFMATLMIIVTMFMNMRGLVPFSICLVCLFFMWLETACGICVGCKIYRILVKKKWLRKPQNHIDCPGEICAIE